MNILHLTCSTRGGDAESERLSRLVVTQLKTLDPKATVSERRLGDDPLPHIDAAFAQALMSLEDTVADGGSLALSDHLIVELRAATHVVIGTPVHNFTVPSVLKAWVDHVLRINRTFASLPSGKVGLLTDRPVYIALASGGTFTVAPGGQPDFIRPYLTAVFATMGITNVQFLGIEGTVFGPEVIAASTAAALSKLDGLLSAAGHKAA